MTPMLSTRILVLAACAPALDGCASLRNDALRTEIEALKEEVSGVEAAIETNTAVPGGLTRDLHGRVSYEPLQAWAARFNERPADERTVRFRQDVREGYIARKKFSCPIGRGGWYVEFNSSDATRADVTIEQLRITPVSGGLNAGTPLYFNLRTQIHGHYDPCIGGGVGTSVGVTADKRVPTTLAFRLLPIQGGRLPYRLDLVDPRNIDITVEVHLGKIGTIGIPVEISNVARTLGEGSIDLLFKTEGRLGPLPDGQAFTYRLQTVAPNIVATPEAIEMATDIDVSVQPAAP